MHLFLLNTLKKGPVVSYFKSFSPPNPKANFRGKREIQNKYGNLKHTNKNRETAVPEINIERMGEFLPKIQQRYNADPPDPSYWPVGRVDPPPWRPDWRADPADHQPRGLKTKNGGCFIIKYQLLKNGAKPQKLQGNFQILKINFTIMAIWIVNPRWTV